MGKIDTRIHDPDGHAVTRLCIRAVFHGESGMRLVNVERSQGPQACKFRVRAMVGGDGIAAAVKFIPRDTAVIRCVNAHTGWWR